jgi:hypothetical protein
MRNGMILASLAALGLAGPAVAHDFSYSFVELGWMQSEIDDLDADGDGFGIRGSMEFTPALHGFVSYSDQDFDFAGLTATGETLEIGVGYAWSLSQNIDVVGRVLYSDVSVEAAGVSADDSGIGIGGYLRGAPTDRLELTGGIDLIDYDESGSDTAFGVGALFHFTKMFSGGLSMTFNDDGTQYMLGGRMNFGNGKK